MVAVAMACVPANGWGQEAVILSAVDRPLTESFDEVYRVGSIDGDAWETFGDIGGTAFDAAGNLYVFDRQGNRITMIDRSGDFVREVGGPGDGPGEFRMAVEFTAMPDGQLVVADMGHRAYQLFSPDGEFERLVSMGFEGGVLRLGEIAPHPEGGAVISGGGTTMMAMRSGPGGGVQDDPEGRPIDIVMLGGAEVTTQTLAVGWEPPRAGPTNLEGGGATFRVAMGGPRTFEPPLLIGVLPNGGVVFSDSSTYALKVTDPNGGVTRVLHRPFEPRPVTEAMQQAERERRLAELEEGGGPQMRIMVGGRGGGAPQALGQDQMRAIMEDQISQLQFYEELPVVRDLSTSWNGRIWVERRGESPTGPGPIDVLTDEGTYQGTFAAAATEMPSSFGPDGLAAYVELDDFDVPTVVVRRLPPVLN